MNTTGSSVTNASEAAPAVSNEPVSLWAYYMRQCFKVHFSLSDCLTLLAFGAAIAIVVQGGFPTTETGASKQKLLATQQHSPLSFRK